MAGRLLGAFPRPGVWKDATMDPDENTPKSFVLSPALHRYVLDHTEPLPAVDAALVTRTRGLGVVARMQVAPEQAALLTMLTRLTQARCAVEVGTFTGLSALAIARGLAPDGRLLCCDVNEDWATTARAAWADAGLADRIDLVIAPAAETLAALPEDTVVDLAFIDADKEGYVEYFELLVPRLRPGGLLVADNVLWSGAVVDPGATDAATEAIRRFNRHAAADPRVETVMLPVADGILVCMRR